MAEATVSDEQLRQIVALRKLPVHDRKEMEAILDVYKSALGIG